MRITARVVVVDREAADRAGVSYLALDDGRIQVVSRGGRGGVAADGPLGIRAFLDLARQRRWTRSESTQMVMVLSGSPAQVASLDGSASAYGSRARGPVLTVFPTVLPDGRVRIGVTAGVQDRGETVWGAWDASPARVETEIIARSGEEVTVASSAAAESRRSSGVLRLARLDRQRDVVVVLTPEVLP